MRVARTVLRGRGDGDAALLPDKWDPRKFISLDELARLLGLVSQKENGRDGSRVYDRFCEGPRAHEDLAAYCMADVRVLRQCWYRMTFPEGPEPEEV